MLITKVAAYLSLTEIVVGTTVESLRLPLAGHFLSLNQGMYLCSLCKKINSRRQAVIACYEVSAVAAALKSLTPALRKLGPMLSLVMQGLLFSLGILILGRGRWGQRLGFLFLSVWAFIQPLITLFISYGPKQINDMLQFYSDHVINDYSFIGQTILWAIITVFIFKILLAMIITQLAPNLDDIKLNTWNQKVVDYSIKKVSSSAKPKSKTIWHDLTKPLFLFSIILTLLFIIIRTEDLSQAVWYGLRPVGIYLLLNYIFKSEKFLKTIFIFSKKSKLLKSIIERSQKVNDYLKNLETDQGKIL